MKIRSLLLNSLRSFAAILFVTSVAHAEPVPVDTDALATIAVQDHGRKKPFTTFVQETVLTLTGHSSLKVENPDGTTTSYTPEQVVLNLWFKPEGWDDKPVVMLNFLELKQKLGLPDDRKLFSFNELINKPALGELLNEAQKQSQMGKGETMGSLLKEAEHLGERLRLFQDLTRGLKETIVPSTVASESPWSAPTGDNGAFAQTVIPAKPDAAPVPLPHTAAATLTLWAQAYHDSDIERFNELTPQVRSELHDIAPQFYPAASTLRFEHQYMTVDPFLKAWIVYAIALVILLLTAIWLRPLGYAVTWLLVLTGLGFEIYGFYCRVAISGRPPVTDLYETVIWVSFIGMIFAVILEAIYRKRFFLYAGLPAAIITLIIADSDSTVLDASINPLTAVLRNNMWLMIHVLTIVSSYAALLLTAALAHIALALTFWGRRFATAQADLHTFIYRAMQIGILLLATGTILGGVWANYSWGRFWGWDPKETWALITLLFYLALVHGRLAGWWRGFGLAVGAVLCFMSVMMSWYGVNFILGQNGRSLHSYGLSTGGLGYVITYAVIELGFVAAVLWWHKRNAPARSTSRATAPTADFAEGEA